MTALGYYKVGQELLKSEAGNLLQLRQSLLQIGAGIAKRGIFIVESGK